MLVLVASMTVVFVLIESFGRFHFRKAERTLSS